MSLLNNARANHQRIVEEVNGYVELNDQDVDELEDDPSSEIFFQAQVLNSNRNCMDLTGHSVNEFEALAHMCESHFLTLRKRGPAPKIGNKDSIFFILVVYRSALPLTKNRH